MTFPATNLGITVEAAIGVITGGNPANWPWLDLTPRLFAQTLTISRGEENESSGLQPASANLELGNLDGWLTPNNPASPWWPYYRRGTPVRISIEGARKGAFLPGGTGNYWSTPHATADNIAGDLDLRVQLNPDNWAFPDDGADYQPIIGIWDTTAANQQWAFRLTPNGSLDLDYMTSGGVFGGFISTRLVASQRPTWLGATLDVNNGAGGRTATFYRWDDDVIPPPADITTWTLIESVAQSGTITLRTASTATLKVGSFFTAGRSMRGHVHAAQVRNGINGTVVLNADFTTPTVGATSFTDTTSRAWTRAGTAVIGTTRTRFLGTIDSIQTIWPYGGHRANTQNTTLASECHSRITVSDVVRRLGQGNKPLEGTLRRIVTSPVQGNHVLAYWPMEDARGAVRAGSGLPNGHAMAVTGLDMAADATLASSAPLPTAPNDKDSSWQGAIGGSAPTHWAMDMFWRAESGPPDPTATRLFIIWCEGSIGQWAVSITSTTFWVAAWDRTGAQVLNSSSGFSSTNFGPWIITRLEVVQNGANIDWTVSFVNLGTGSAGALNDSLAGTIGSPRTVLNWLLAGDTPDGISIGHIIVTDGTLPINWLAAHDTAWVGESVAHRVWRLAREEGLSAEIIGDSTMGVSGRGDLGLSQPMGYQAQASLLTLLDQAAEVDLGFLASRPNGPGFIYRCRATLDNQPVRMILDATTNAVTIPLEPTLDDQRIRNDITVPMIDGTSARAIDQDSIDAEGLYQVEVPAINGVGGVLIQDAIIVSQSGLDIAIGYQADWQAGWRLALGVLGANVRYPQIRVDLALAPQLLDDWHALGLGDRIQLVGLPNQHPAEPVDLIVEHIGDTVTPTSWIGTLSGSPTAPYFLGVLDA